MADVMKPGALAGATGPRETVLRDHRTATTVAKKRTLVIFEGEDGPRSVALSGRVLWTLRELVRAGPRGVTPIERPAPRWSDYVFKLREVGLAIGTIRERHGGDYPGAHGRYVLRTPVAIKGGADV